MKDDQITGGIFGVAIGDALGVPGDKLSMFPGIKGTWYEYSTIVKTFKNILAYSKPVRNPKRKNCKEKQIKTIAK